MVVSYVIVDKQCAWQQDRSPEGSDKYDKDLRPFFVIIHQAAAAHGICY